MNTPLVRRKHNRGNRKPGPRPKRTSKAVMQARIWDTLRVLAGTGMSFTAKELAHSAQVPASTAGYYVRALARAGIVRVREQSKSLGGAYGATPAKWTLARKLPEKPPMVAQRDRAARPQGA